VIAANTIALTASAAPVSSDLIITGVIDGPISGGLPKAIELYVVDDITDLSSYGLGTANNGAASAGVETSLTGSASAGQFLYVSEDSTEFSNFFGFAPDIVAGGGASSFNGDDVVELFMGNSVVDVFGELGVDGTGEPWEYLDGWSYRKDATGPDGSSFVLSSWTFSGANALDGLTSNTGANAFPIGSYQGMAPIPLPASFPLLLAGLGGLAWLRRRKIAA